MADPNMPMSELELLREDFKRICTKVDDLGRALQGDPMTGTLALREQIKELKNSFKDDIDDATERLERIEKAAAAQENYLKGIVLVVRWAGGGTLVGLLALIGQLTGLWPGGK